MQRRGRSRHLPESTWLGDGYQLLAHLGHRVVMYNMQAIVRCPLASLPNLGVFHSVVLNPISMTIFQSKRVKEMIKRSVFRAWEFLK